MAGWVAAILLLASSLASHRSGCPGDDQCASATRRAMSVVAATSFSDIVECTWPRTASILPLRCRLQWIDILVLLDHIGLIFEQMGVPVRLADACEVLITPEDYSSSSLVTPDIFVTDQPDDGSGQECLSLHRASVVFVGRLVACCGGTVECDMQFRVEEVVRGKLEPGDLVYVPHFCVETGTYPSSKKFVVFAEPTERRRELSVGNVIVSGGLYFAPAPPLDPDGVHFWPPFHLPVDRWTDFAVTRKWERICRQHNIGEK